MEECFFLPFVIFIALRPTPIQTHLFLFSFYPFLFFFAVGPPVCPVPMGFVIPAGPGNEEVGPLFSPTPK